MLFSNSMLCRSARGARLAGVVASLALGACGDDRSDATPAPVEPEPLAQVTTADDGTMTVNDADGTYFAAVRPEGAGCPAGTFQTRISDDGKVFTTTFSAFELKLSQSDVEVTRDCQLKIDLRSPGGRSFCVQSIAYQGYAFLEDDVWARQTADYYFNEQKVKTDSIREDLFGPYDSDFLFRDDVAVEDELWTPCDEERELLVSTSLLLQNGAVSRTGYINVSSADGDSQLQLRVVSHRCDMARDAGWTFGSFYDRADNPKASTQSGSVTSSNGRRTGSGSTVERTVH